MGAHGDLSTLPVVGALFTPKNAPLTTPEDEISVLLKNTVEQQTVVGPLVRKLVAAGWSKDQMIFGKKKWRVPKAPSEATKREKGRTFAGFPVDIAVFDSKETLGDPSHILFIVECKQNGEKAGVSQLESYFVGEPHAKLGIWTNSADETASGVFLYRGTNGGAILKKSPLKAFPRLVSPFANGRFSVVVTNPPFGKNLKVSATDCR